MTEQTTKVEQQAVALRDEAKAVTIASDPDNMSAGALLKQCKAAEKDVKAVFSPMKKKTQDAHKEVVAQEKKVLAPLIEAIEVIKTAMIAYSADCEKKRIAQEAKLQAKALRDAEKKRAKEIKKLEDAGETDAAEALVDAPIEVANITLAKAEAVEGVSKRCTWKARVVDANKLVKAVAKGDASAEFVKVNETALNQFARATKGTIAVDGVVFEVVESVAVRTE